MSLSRKKVTARAGAFGGKGPSRSPETWPRPRARRFLPSPPATAPADIEALRPSFPGVKQMLRSSQLKVHFKTFEWGSEDYWVHVVFIQQKFDTIMGAREFRAA